jgi:hypothetical protein
MDWYLAKTEKELRIRINKIKEIDMTFVQNTMIDEYYG